MKLLRDYLANLGRSHNLTVSNQEILKCSMMGLDDKRKKMLIVTGLSEGRPHHEIIDLNDVRSCSVKKYYGKIDVNGLKDRELNQYLEKIVLQIGFRSIRQSADILFYRRTDNDIRELPELELKARKWMELLSENLPSSLNKKLPLQDLKL